MIKVAEISRGRIEDGDFQDRLVGAIIYRAFQVSMLLQNGVQILNFPTPLIDNVGKHHVDEKYMQKKFFQRYKGPVIICRDNELDLLKRLNLP